MRIMEETDCRKCCVSDFKNALCKKDFCEKYYREGNAEDFEKLLPHWIPCSERLPHMHGWYLCTLIDGRVNSYYWNNNGVWLDNAKKHLFDLYEIRSRYTGMEIKPEDEAVYWTEWVVAWMPMPERYKGE